MEILRRWGRAGGDADLFLGAAWLSLCNLGAGFGSRCLDALRPEPEIRCRRTFRFSASSSDSAFNVFLLCGTNLLGRCGFSLIDGFIRGIPRRCSEPDSDCALEGRRRACGGGDAGAELRPLEPSLLRGLSGLSSSFFLLDSPIPFEEEGKAGLSTVSPRS